MRFARPGASATTSGWAPKSPGNVRVAMGGLLGSHPIMASTPHLSRNQLDRFEERLQRERARLLGSTQPDSPSDMPGLADPGDAADVAEVQVERATRNTLTEGERSQLAQVNRALLKLAEGSYGLS